MFLGGAYERVVWAPGKESLFYHGAVVTASSKAEWNVPSCRDPLNS